MSTRFTVLLAALLLGACSSEVRRGPEDETPARATRVASTRGGAMVLSRDERIAVVANRSAGVVTVFRLNRDKPLDQLIEGHTEIDMDESPLHQRGGPGSEPWAAVIGVDDDTAYVISRYDQTVSRIVNLHTDPQIDRQIAVGSEPTAIAIAPTGNRIFVANWAEGTISVVVTDERDFYPQDPFDLNAAVARTGLLGDL